MAAPEIVLDLKPTRTVEELGAKFLSREKVTVGEVSRAWRLGPVAQALLRLKSQAETVEDYAALSKSYRVVLKGPRPIEEAISTAGGVDWKEVDEALMLKRWPGIFCAGEMLDWDAPTGGYLLQGCFSTATRAAKGVVEFLAK
jgi:predicted flavoprotein YhiN